MRERENTDKLNLSWVRLTLNETQSLLANSDPSRSPVTGHVTSAGYTQKI